MTSNTLQSEHLVFRPATPADREMLHSHWTRPEVRRYLFDDEAIDITLVDQFIADNEASFRYHRYGHWILESPGDATFLGYAGIRPVPEYNAPEILYSIEPEQWGRGLATEAARRLADYALNELNLPRVAADTDSPNTNSARVLEKAGFTFLGEFERHGLPTLCFEMKQPTK